MHTTPRASAVILTYDRPSSLAGALAAVGAQTVPLEIVVVHDGDKHADEVDRLCERAGARLLRVPQGGIAKARNHGTKRATHDVILGLDDDCEPVPEWAARMIEAFDRGAEVVAGGVINAEADNPYGAATQVIHDHLMDTPDLTYATTNNIGARRHVFLHVPYDPAYMTAGEDRDWCRRVERLGYRLERVPEAAVLHRQPLTLKSFVRKHATYGRGSSQFRHEHETPRFPVRWYAALVRRGFRDGPRTGALVVLAQAAGAYGAATQAGRRRRNRGGRNST